jgi:hypothetical protein
VPHDLPESEKVVPTTARRFSAWARSAPSAITSKRPNSS